MSATVSLIKIDSYDDISLIEQSLEEGLKPFGGMGAFVHPGERILLKANLLAPAKPHEAVTTHPEIVRAAIRACKKAGAGAILVGDGPGVGRTIDNARVCGIEAVCREEGAQLADFDAIALYDNPANAI